MSVIRKAVEYANGWVWDVDEDGEETVLPAESSIYFLHDDLPQFIKDALAAQLVRQIDAMNYEIISSEGHCAVYDQEHQVNTLEVNSSYDRTDNTLNACVEFYDNE